MSQLSCPNCGHHIGNLTVEPRTPKLKTDDVAAWLDVTSWAGWEDPASLFRRYSNWAKASGHDPLSQRMFSLRLVRLGARFKSTKTGREYAPPLPAPVEP